MKTKLLFFALALVGATFANTVTPQFTSFNSGTGTVVYSADLTSGELWDGDGFTIFDVGGFTGFGLLSPGWTASVTVGSPYGAPLVADNADANLTFVYHGATTEVAFGATAFTPFTVLTNSHSLVTDDWTSRDHLLGVAGVIDGAMGPGDRASILVPAHVPDGGSTVVLLGAALAGLAIWKRK